MLKRILKSMQSREVAPPAAIPAGQRVYAIGDIHGRLDQFDALLAMIDADNAVRGPADVQLILLGDLIDRGPESAGVVDRAMNLARDGRSVRFLMGNHEELFLAALAGADRAMRVFTQVGGRETLLSYGMSRRDYDDATFEELVELAIGVVPASHTAFLNGFEDSIEIGDYLFVHAGVRPDVPLGEQTASDLRWIRREFLEHRGTFGKMIVHGHTITDDIDSRPNRIGIDTGAYRSGRLTAIGLERTEKWFLQTAPNNATSSGSHAVNVAVLADQ